MLEILKIFHKIYTKWTFSVKNVFEKKGVRKNSRNIFKNLENIEQLFIIYF